MSLEIIYNLDSRAGKLTSELFSSEDISGELLIYLPKSGTYAAVQTSLLLVLPEDGSESEAKNIFTTGGLGDLAEREHLCIAFLLSKQKYANGSSLLDDFYTAIQKKKNPLPCHISLIYHIGFGSSADLLMNYGQRNPANQAGLLAISPVHGGSEIAKAPVPMMIYQGSEHINRIAQKMNDNDQYAKTIICGLEAGNLQQIIQKAYTELFSQVRRWRNSINGTLLPRIDFAESIFKRISAKSLVFIFL